MRGMLVLNACEDDDEFKYSFSLNEDDTDYQIMVSIDLNESFTELISTTEELEDSIRFQLEIEDDKNIAKIYKECLDNCSNILSNAEFILFNFDIEDVFAYINRNPILKSKKIVLQSNAELDPSEVEHIKKVFGNDTDNIYINMAENTSPISFKEYSDTLNALDEIVKDVSRFSFTPIEKIMYVYDIVRSKVAVHEDIDEDQSISRDLSSSLLGDKIVCLGYSRIFKSILDRLGIPSRKVYLNSAVPGEDGHARNEIYIKDDKYNIDGVYFFDATWDSKRGNDNRYLLCCRCFGKTKEQMYALDQGEIIDTLFPYYSVDIAEEFRSIPLEELSLDMVKSINHISKVINGKYLINRLGLPQYGLEAFKIDKDEVIKELEPLVGYFNRPISAETLVEILYNVRKIEYYENPSKYPFSLNDFYRTIINSGWYFKGTPEERLLLLFAGREDKLKIISSQTSRYSNETGLNKNIETIKLTKTLRMISDKKNN